jgi:hypothetical protein
MSALEFCKICDLDPLEANKRTYQEKWTGKLCLHSLQQRLVLDILVLTA